MKPGNRVPSSPVTSLAFDMISNLAVEVSPRLKTPRRCLPDSLAAARDPSSSAMDVDAEPAALLAEAGEPEILADDAVDGDSPVADDMDLDDGSPLGRLKPALTFRQTKLSFAGALVTSEAMQDGERATGSKRPISSLNHTLTPAPKLLGRSPFGKELTSHWSQRRPTNFGRASSNLKVPSPVRPSRQPLAMAMTPSNVKRDAQPAETPTIARLAPVATENPPSAADAVNYGTSPSVGAPPAKFRRTQSTNSNAFPSIHRYQSVTRHCNSMPTVPTLPAEGSTILPSIETGKDALKRISPSTLVDVLDGRYKDRYDEHYIVDCRFPYEYEGGHIPTAVNVNTMDALERMFVAKPMAEKKVLLVFHCEFSSQRAPRMALHLRSQDRRMNVHNYPHLHYPEVYILKGGYKDFFAEYKERCSPQAYVEMAHESFKEECKASMSLYKSSFRRSKSYTEGPSGVCVAFRRSTSFTVGTSTTSVSSKEKPDVF